MSEDQKEKAFDPFHTMRRGKKVTRSGMSIVFNFITQTLKGSIEVQNAVNNGVSFTMMFPAHWENNSPCKF